jgi:DNA-binding transcriptional regulator YiaG
MSAEALDALMAEVEARRALPPPPVRRAIRRAAKVSQEKVGAAVGVTGVAVLHWEHGRVEPSSEHVGPYVEVLNKLKGSA